MYEILEVIYPSYSLLWFHEDKKLIMIFLNDRSITIQRRNFTDLIIITIIAKGYALLFTKYRIIIQVEMSWFLRWFNPSRFHLTQAQAGWNFSSIANSKSGLKSSHVIESCNLESFHQRGDLKFDVIRMAKNNDGDDDTDSWKACVLLLITNVHTQFIRPRRSKAYRVWGAHNK